MTGNPDLLSEFVAIDRAQGAQLCGSVVLGSDCALLPRRHHRPHLEHLEPVAGAAGEKSNNLEGCLALYL